jgi:hypothetical protein
MSDHNDNNLLVLRLCHFLHRLNRLRLNLEQTRRRVSYYTSISLAVKQHDYTVTGTEKWKNNPKRLHQKLQQSQLEDVKAQERYFNFLHSEDWTVTRGLMSDLRATFLRDSKRSNITGITLKLEDNRNRIISAREFEAKAEQYEVEVLMSNLLNDVPE